MIYHKYETSNNYGYVGTNEYSIKINSNVITCASYSETMLKVPLRPEHKETLGEVAKYAFNLFTGTHLFSTYDPNDEELEYANIKVLCIVDSIKDKTFFVVTDNDRETIRSVMDCGATCADCVPSYTDSPYKRACKTLFLEGRYVGYHSSRYDRFDEEYFTQNYKILFGYYKNRSYALSVEHLDSIKKQFELQDEQRKEEIKRKEEQQLAEQEAIRKAKQEEESRKHQAFLASVKIAKAKYSAMIMSDFHEQNLLSNSSLSNNEKLNAYSALRNFCYKYIPVLAERGFSVEALHGDYSDYFSEEVYSAFKQNWIRLSRSYNVLSRGAAGEEKVYEVLRLFDDRIRILRDYVWGHEHDFIVITPYGISTIEVKNLRGDYVLTETGVLKCVSSDKVKSKDVALQSKKHLETLRRNLNSCSAFSANIPLQEIICSAESNFTIRDDYHYIPVCYYNTVDKALFPENTKPILNEKAMDAIEKYLLENRREAFKFDVFLPRGEIDSRADFIKCFADVASGYIVAQTFVE